MNFCLKFAKFRKNLAIISRKGDKMRTMQKKERIKNKPKARSKEFLNALADLKAPSSELLTAIKQAQNGETTQWDSLDDFKKAMSV